jgi:hypothetical protein
MNSASDSFRCFPRRLLERLSHDDTKQCSEGKVIRLDCGVNRGIDLVSLEELDLLAKQVPSFSYVTCVADNKRAFRA